MKVKIDTANRGSVLVAALQGELDHHAAENVRNTLDKELAKGKIAFLVLDLRDISFMDSSGLGVILGRYRKIKADGGEMAISGVPPAVAKLFEISGMHKIVQIYKAKEDAIQAMKGATK